MYDVRYPAIHGKDTATQIAEIRNYLFQHAEQMQFILNDLYASATEQKDNNTTPKTPSFQGVYGKTKEVSGNTLTVKTSGSERQVLQVFGALSSGAMHGYAFVSKTSSPVWEGTSGVTLSFANDTLTITFPETVNDYVTVISNRRFTF